MKRFMNEAEGNHEMPIGTTWRYIGVYYVQTSKGPVETEEPRAVSVLVRLYHEVNDMHTRSMILHYLHECDFWSEP
jgi:hypothetical protein